MQEILGYRTNLEIHEKLEKEYIWEIQGYLANPEIHENLDKLDILKIRPRVRSQEHISKGNRNTFPEEIGQQPF